MNRTFRPILLQLLLLFLLNPVRAGFKNGRSADLVLGQAGFVTDTAALSQTGMSFPRDIATDPVSGKVFVCDSTNDRILRFASHLSLTNGAQAEVVIGQDDFDSNDVTDLGQSRLDGPARLYVDHEGRLWVADQNNNRVLRFDNAASLATGAAANGVLGQSGFDTDSSGTTPSTMHSPVGVAGDANGTLWVADQLNHRVLRFDNAAQKANGASADGVLGQPDFVTATPGTSSIRMFEPTGIHLDKDGRLWVGERINNRVLRFDNAALKSDGAGADGVLGQSLFNTNTPGLGASGMTLPADMVMGADGTLFVADFSNHRVLGFIDASGKADGAGADLVFCQPDLDTTETNLDAAGSNGPQGLSLDPLGRLYVADSSFNRVTRFSPDGTPTIFTSKRETTRGSSLTLRGTATSDLLVTKVEVKAVRGGFKKAKGTTAWNYRVRGLTKGATRAKVKATSLDGKTAQKTVRIQRK